MEFWRRQRRLMVFTKENENLKINQPVQQVALPLVLIKEKGDIKDVVLGALEAANASHAPYSGCPSEMALVDQHGNIFKGSYMESDAYNPSLGPAQAAMIAYIAATGEIKPGYGEIVSAVLVEKEGGFVRQEDTVRLFLRAVLPKC
ncbi:cytidine deaminase 1-like [Silene latifolia]|uniref:cytidine deaminase 1-like n=1 Tax=Silene latifolia TaxID=37657 RepID=UPI003D774AE4